MDSRNRSRTQTPWTSSQRGDGRSLAIRYGRGFTLIELLVAVSIFGVVAIAGLPHVNIAREDINTSVQRIVSDMRYARGRAITSGEHYAVEWTSDRTYEVQRMMEAPGGEWQVDDVERRVELPTQISFVLGDDSVARLEFNTRGMLISSEQPLRPVVTDQHNLVERHLSIWPSGQIFVEE